MLVFASISLKICFADRGGHTVLPRPQYGQLTIMWGGGGERANSASAFSLGHRRKNRKKVESRRRRPLHVVEACGWLTPATALVGRWVATAQRDGHRPHQVAQGDPSEVSRPQRVVWPANALRSPAIGS